MKIANKDARRYVTARREFIGSNTYGENVHRCYVVFSYGDHWPLYAYVDGRWYGNSSKYSVTTSKHSSQLMPVGEDITWLPLAGMFSTIREHNLTK